MQYDPIKRRLGRLFNHRPWTRRLFYRLLDILLLRTWHIHRALRQFSRTKGAGQMHVLDAGSGFGQYTWYMARKNKHWQITAIDIKADEIKDCQQFFKQTGREDVRFLVKDLTSYVAPEAHDLILSVDVMEHIEADELVFRNFCTSLKPGGMLLISTPSDQGGSDVHHQEDQSFIEEHVRDGYGKQEIRDKLLAAGFDQVESQYTYGRPGSLAWRISMKYPILWLGKSKALLFVLPLYYLVTMPLVLLLNLADLQGSHRSGTGLMVKAWKMPDEDGDG